MIRKIFVIILYFIFSRPNLWSVGSVEQKFIKLDPTSVKDVLIKRVFVQCVERKSLIQRATVSHLPKKNIYYYGEKFSYHYIILLLLVLSSVTPQLFVKVSYIRVFCNVLFFRTFISLIYSNSIHWKWAVIEKEHFKMLLDTKVFEGCTFKRFFFFKDLFVRNK